MQCTVYSYCTGTEASANQCNFGEKGVVSVNTIVT